ncbi:hypothetical protein HL658_25735 [Azospirillum sp. RWY-5-1]|uniref:Uncharacterized protein n=1 Tax=Azospirillum oleiclasticum TaxID=2735135 RepID=A0ABX2TGS6_9PROT|nr:hypothetical protein [Azospirillum oleiclasticum]NYZ15957.1 hypothetical protein [Azospirillum oleiclasticum]NYZ23564.1 hypothetical protein [Azospirillum oleiclasticum]
MAFVCTLDGNTRFEFMQDGPSAVVIVRVGCDHEEGANWFVHVGLDVMAGGDLEYFFRLWRVDAFSGRETAYNSGRETAHAIHGDDRTEVLKAALMATRLLLEHAQPDRVYRVTYDASPPDSALEKHHAISDVFYSCGYRVFRYDEFHGQRMWWMERDTVAGVDQRGESCLDRAVDGGCDEPRDADTRDGRDGGTGSAASEPLAVES